MSKYINFSDNELVLLASKGNEKAFSEIYDRYIKLIYNKCRSFARISDEADDLTQEVFIKINGKLHLYKEDNFRAWVTRLTYNTCVDYHRKESKQKFESINEELLKGINEEYSISDDELFEIKAERLKIILEEIEPMDKMILLMKYKDELKIKGIQEVTKLGKSAVKMRLSRIKKKIIELNNTKN